MHTIKTYEDACKALNLSEELPNVSNLPEKHQKSIIAYYKLVIIAEALNEGWQPNWNDWNERKYFFWPEVEASKDNTSGSGFSGSDCDSSCTPTFVGSRLCFKSSDLALYAGKQFEELYIDYLLLK